MILDVARHLGLGGTGLRSLPLEELRVDLPLDHLLVGRLRQYTIELLAHWSLRATTIAETLFAADALGRELSEVLGLATTTEPLDDSGVRDTAELHLTSTPAAVRVDLTLRPSGPRRQRLPSAEQVMHRAMAGRPARWGVEYDADARTMWFEVGTAVGFLPEPHLAALHQTRTAEVVRADLARAVRDVPEPVAAVRAVATVLRRDLRAMFVGAAVREDECLRYVAMVPALPAAIEDWAPLPPHRHSPETVAWTTATRSVHSSVAATAREYDDCAVAMRSLGVESMAYVPVVVDGGCLGVLGAGWPHEQMAEYYVDELGRAADLLAPMLGGGGAGHRPVTVDGASASARDDPARAAVLSSGSVRINLFTRAVTVAGQRNAVRLTGREYELLVHLVRHAGVVQSRQDLLRDVWGISFAADTSVVEVTVSRLRRRLELTDLRTIKDVGYVFGEPSGAVSRARP